MNNSAIQFATLFRDNIFRLHGIPKTHVSDCDPKFTSDFWRELFRQFGLLLNLLRRGGNNFLAQSLHSQLQEPGSSGNQVLHLIKEVPGGHTLPIDTYGRPTKIEQATIKAIVESLIKRESERDRVPVQNLSMRANGAHTRGS
jgi:hypothetical protein